MLISYVVLIFHLSSTFCQQEYFDFQLHHNLTAERLEEDGTERKSFVVNKFATQGFGRVLTWNIKKLGACLRQDNVQQLKETVCAILQSANVIALQEAENLDLSCLPCNAVLKDDYEWPGAGSSEEFKVLVKTRHSRSFSIKKVGKCSTTNKENGAKRQLDRSQRNMYQQVMRAFKVEAEEFALKHPKVNKSIQPVNMSNNVTVNNRFTDITNESNSTTQRQYVPLNNSDVQVEHGLNRFQPMNASHDTATERKVKLTRFLLESESNNFTAGKGNFTNGQNFTDRQVERFLVVNNDASEVNGNDKQELKERLYKSRERLNNAPISENKKERFKVIDTKLNNIEKEIDEITYIDNSSSLVTNQNATSFSDNQNATSFSSNHESLNSTDENATSINEISSTYYPANFSLNNDPRLSNVSLLNIESYLLPEINVSEPDENTIVNLSNVSRGSKKSDVEGSDRDIIHNNSSPQVNDSNSIISFGNSSPEKSIISLGNSSPEKSIISFPNRKQIVLFKNVFRSSGHAVIKRAIKWNRERRLLLSKLKTKEYEGIKRDKQPVVDDNVIEDIHYTIMVITSDLNSGEPFILVNLKLPKEKMFQRRCVGDIIIDIGKVISEEEKSMKILIMGDFHFDRLTGYDSNGWLYKIVNNLHINDENYHAAITYNEKDPITTVYGRRFDNIITNINIQGNMKTIGPDFPLVPDAVIVPFTLQRLYNNYMTAFYTTESDDADSIYECIKAYQIAGKGELDNNVCKDTWVPSSCISDHLPLQITAKFKKLNRVAPVELNIGSWNIQGSSFKERLLDSSVKNAFVKALKNYHVAIFHEFPTHDNILNDDDLGANEIVRLTQGELTTEFGIFINQYSKDGETDMFALRKKFHSPNEDDEKRDKVDIISTVGLFIPKLVIDTLNIRPCLYTVKTSEAEVPSVEDFSSILDAIYKDVQSRDCDFKMLLASLNLDETFNLEKEIYKKYKFINMRCTLPNKDDKYSYNVPRSRDLADYIILIGTNNDITFSDCTIGLPGDEKKRGIEKLNDFEELTTHYPLSVVIKKSDV